MEGATDAVRRAVASKHNSLQLPFSLPKELWYLVFELAGKDARRSRLICRQFSALYIAYSGEFFPKGFHKGLRSFQSGKIRFAPADKGKSVETPYGRLIWKETGSLSGSLSLHSTPFVDAVEGYHLRGTRLLTWSGDKLSVWNLGDPPERLATLDCKRGGPIHEKGRLSVDSFGSYAVSTFMASDGARVWDLRTSREISYLPSHSSTIWMHLLEATPPTVISLDRRHMMRVWSLLDGKVKWEAEVENSGARFHLKAGDQAVVETKHYIRCYNVSSGALTRGVRKNHSGHLHKLQLFELESRHEFLMIYPQWGAQATSLGEPLDAMVSGLLGENQPYAVGCDKASHLTLFDLATGNSVWKQSGDRIVPESIHQCRLSGKPRILAGHIDGRVSIIIPDTGETVHRLEQALPTQWLDLCPLGGLSLVIGRGRKRVSVWNAESGSLLASLKHPTPAYLFKKQRAPIRRGADPPSIGIGKGLRLIPDLEENRASSSAGQ